MPDSAFLDILSLTSDEFRGEVRSVLPSAAERAGRLYARVFADGAFEPEFEGMDSLSAALLGARFAVRLPRVAACAEEEGEAGHTVKFSFRMADGLAVESVAVPMFGGTRTLCVSSQVGCARGCVFCETGTAGLVRDLSASEIVGQVLAAARALDCRFRNVVFMGMGEPLDNLEAVLRAIMILRDQRGLSYSQERLTLCTAGQVEGLRELGRRGLRRLNVSVSLAAARDELRDRLMPINRVWPLAELADALADYPKRRNFAFGVNYCLIPGVNDTPADLDAVADFVGRIGRALVNVIPYNPGRAPIGRSPTEAESAAFLDGLAARGVPVRRRIEKGRSLMAACGQLGGAAPRDADHP